MEAKKFPTQRSVYRATCGSGHRKTCLSRQDRTILGFAQASTKQNRLVSPRQGDQAAGVRPWIARSDELRDSNFLFKKFSHHTLDCGFRILGFRAPQQPVLQSV